jgi:hypothetical protein
MAASQTLGWGASLRRDRRGLTSEAAGGCGYLSGSWAELGNGPLEALFRPEHDVLKPGTVKQPEG